MGSLGRTLTIVSLALFSCSVANAATITFDNLSGPNLSPFTSYQEAGFTVTAAGGSSEQGTIFGNPSPSVIIGAPVFGPVIGSVAARLTAGGTFTFSSMELVSQNGASSFSATGFVSGSPIFSFAGVLPPGTVFLTETNPFAGVFIDSLDITVRPGSGVTSDNLDNIHLNPVPEPMTLLLFGTPAAGLGLARWRQRRQG